MPKQKDDRKRYRYKTFMITFNLYPTNDPIYDNYFLNMISQEKQSGRLNMHDSNALGTFCANVILQNVLLNVNKNPSTSNQLENFYFIVHNKDTYDDGTPKGDHDHIVLAFKKPIELTALWQYSHLVNESSIEKPKAGRYALDSMLGYLTHRTAPDKFQYDLTEVQNWIGNSESYQDHAKKRAQAWKERAGINAKKKQGVSLPSVLLDISHGKLTWDNILLTNELKDLYALNSGPIDKAFEAHDKSLVQQGMQNIKQHKFQKFCIFISGQTRMGKTQLAEALIANVLKACPDWRVYKPSSKSPFDQYTGEEIAFLDDTKGGSQSEEDWLSTLDPNCGKMVHCRYFDRYVSARIIIITSTTTPHNYFAHARSHGANEPLDQFISRFTWFLNVDSASSFFNTYSTKFMDEGVQKPFVPVFGQREPEKLFKPEPKFLNDYADQNSKWLTGDNNRRVVSISIPEYTDDQQRLSFRYGHGKNAYDETRFINYNLVTNACYKYVAPTDSDAFSMKISSDLVCDFLQLVNSKTYDSNVQLNSQEYVLQSPGVATLQQYQQNNEVTQLPSVKG